MDDTDPNLLASSIPPPPGAPLQSIPAQSLPQPPVAPALAQPAPTPQSALAAAVAAGKPILDTKSSSTTTARLAPEQKQDLATIADLGKRGEAAVDAETKEKIKAADAERAAQADAIKAAEATQAAKSQAILEAQQRRAAAEAQYQQKLEEFNGQKFHDFWSSRTKAGEVLADIGVVLGAFGSAGRGENGAADILRNRIAEDFQQQRQNVEMAKDRVVMAKAGVNDADEARRILLDDIDIKNAAAVNAVQQRLKAAQISSGAMLTAEGEKAKVGLAKDFESMRQKTTSVLTQHMTSESKYLNPEAEEFKQGLRAEKKEKEDKSEVFNKKGELQGFVTTGKGGAQAFMTRDVQTTEAIKRAEALLASAEQDGKFAPIDTNRRGLVEGAIGAAATTSPMGKTVESMHTEAGMMGITKLPGGGSYVNTDILRNRIAQMKETQQNYMTQGLIPPTPEEVANWNARRAKSPVTQAAAAEKKETAATVHSSEAPVGTTKTAPDGRTWRKVGPNNWQPES
jgi:hypothetical protein